MAIAACLAFAASYRWGHRFRTIVVAGAGITLTVAAVAATRRRLWVFRCRPHATGRPHRARMVLTRWCDLFATRSSWGWVVDPGSRFNASKCWPWPLSPQRPAVATGLPGGRRAA